MKVTNLIKCKKKFRKDGNTEYIPILKVVGNTMFLQCDRDEVTLQIDSGKIVSIKGNELIAALKNAMNT
jgi:hypothetical protein